MTSRIEELVQAIQTAQAVARDTGLLKATHIKLFDSAIHAARKRDATRQFKEAIAARKAVRAAKN